MKIKPDKILQLIDELDEIRSELRNAEETHQKVIKSVSSTYTKSAKNLIHYYALRQHDLRPIQKKLRNLGLSRFNNAIGHVLATLLNTQFILSRLLNQEHERKKPGLSIKNGRKLLNNHTKELLGYRSRNRRVRIMVTLPSESAYDYALVKKMIQAGMNCARINCAHDHPAIWKMMIDNVRRAASSLDKKVVIAMDLAGPKIRTGAILPGPKVRKFAPERDDTGNVIKPALVVMVPHLNQDSTSKEIPVGQELLAELHEGTRLSFVDTRGKERKLKVTSRDENEVLLDCYDTCYIGTGTVFNVGTQSFTVQEIPPIEQSLLLRVNDSLTIHKDSYAGVPAKFDEHGELIQQASISCQLGEVFGRIKKGHKVLFDDGKIAGKVVGSEEDHFEVCITKAKPAGSKLKAEKGINFPETDLGIKGLTSKDREDLSFIVQHADVVNFSFVNDVSDVEDLLAELEKLGVKDKLNIILKIETKEAFDHLQAILLAAMRTSYIGVMIARGDLAVETGWDKIGWVQREILYACNAAHIPVVWATQVLENLAKKGLPSRSEITDATTSLKAECVMLNKGPFITEAIQLLDKILSDLEEYHEKNENMLPKLRQLRK